MANTETTIQALLAADEPDYEMARSLGAGALPILRRLVAARPAEAARAVWIASFVPDASAAEVIEIAAGHADPMVRAAAAAAARNVPGSLARIVPRLLRDPDPGVRKQALRSASHAAAPASKTALQQMAHADPEAFLRQAASDALKGRFKP